eukprot:557773-Pleurochrysis_carterae.AAC.6
MLRQAITDKAALVRTISAVTVASLLRQSSSMSILGAGQYRADVIVGRLAPRPQNYLSRDSQYALCFRFAIA